MIQKVNKNKYNQTYYIQNNVQNNTKIKKIANVYERVLKIYV